MTLRGLSSWGIQIGSFAAGWAPFVPKIFQLFQFHTGRPILITPEGQLLEKGILPIPNVDETEGFQCLAHSNWTICSPLSPFLPKDIWTFPSFSLSYWDANSYYPRGPIMGKGNSPNFKIVWDRGASVPGSFKLDHLQPIKPLLFPNFYNFFTFILGGQFLLPQKANIGKRQFPNSKTEWDRGFPAPGAF